MEGMCKGGRTRKCVVMKGHGIRSGKMKNEEWKSWISINSSMALEKKL